MCEVLWTGNEKILYLISARFQDSGSMHHCHGSANLKGLVWIDYIYLGACFTFFLRGLKSGQTTWKGRYLMLSHQSQGWDMCHVLVVRNERGLWPICRGVCQASGGLLQLANVWIS